MKNKTHRSIESKFVVDAKDDAGPKEWALFTLSAMTVSGILPPIALFATSGLWRR